MGKVAIEKKKNLIFQLTAIISWDRSNLFNFRLLYLARNTHKNKIKKQCIKTLKTSVATKKHIRFGF